METKTVEGDLQFGLTLGERVLKHYKLREALTEDLFRAEKDAPPDNALAFNAALMCRQLVSLDDYTGPFTISMIGKLKPSDYGVLRAAQMEVQELGEAPAGSTARN